MNDLPRIDLHPDSYEQFVSLFERTEQAPGTLGLLFGVPVYLKDYMPLNKAFLTTGTEMVVFSL